MTRKIGSRLSHTVFYKADNHKLCMVKCGCFSGTITEFSDKVKETHGDNKHAQDYAREIEIAKIIFGG